VTVTSPDHLLRDAVKRHLAWATEVSDGRIGVAAENAVVTLRGYVDTQAEVFAAERIARKVVGVERVLNELEVWPPVFHGFHRWSASPPR